MRHPPSLARLLALLAAGRRDRDAVVGDLDEEWSARAGRPGARLWYWSQVVRSLPPLLDRRRARGWARLTTRDGDGMMRTFWRDLGHGMRTLRRAPLFGAMVVGTLALGIGANTTIFSAVSGTVLDPFPFPEPDRVVGVGTAYPRIGEGIGFFENLSPAEYLDILEQARTLEDVVAWDMGNRQIDGEGPPENVFTAFWWGDPIRTVGMRPHLGRGFTEAEVREGARVAMLSHRLWRTRFGADSTMLGQAVSINGDPYTLVGIVPEGMLIYGTDLWTVMPVSPAEYPRNRRQFQVLARVREDATLDAVNAELEGIARRVEAQWGAEFDEYQGWRIEARTWTDVNVATLRPAAMILLGAVGFVLLLVCANVANMLLARSARRRQEMAVRTALGAGRGRLVRQLLTESVALAMLGGVAGVAVAAAGVRGIRAWVDALGLPVPGTVTIDGRVLLFTAGVSILAGVLFGLAPAWQVARRNLQDALRSEGKTSTGSPSRQRVQRILVAVEVALALALLTGGGLLARSLLALGDVDPGWDAERVLTMRLTVPPERYAPDEIPAFFRTVVDRVEALPGVTAAGAATQFPGRAFMRRDFWVEGRPMDAEGTRPSAFTTVVTDDVFEVLGVDLLRGRGFGPDDVRGAPVVAVVNETAARRFFPGGDAVGRRVKLGGPDSDAPWIRVVGVVSDTRNRALDQEPVPELYAPQAQLGGGNQLFLLVRTAGDPRAVLPGVRRTIAELDPDQAVYAIQTAEEVYAGQAASQRATATFLGIFAIFAVVLAAGGIYAVVSYSVAARVREIGLRMALGAQASRVRTMVVAQTLLPVVLGAVAGLGLSVVVGRAMEGLLFGVHGTDPATLGGMTLLLLVVAAGASWIPALRASHLDPATTLRLD